MNGDAQPHDVDIHEPAYLVADARHAVQVARQDGVRVAALLVGAPSVGSALRIFGSRGCAKYQGEGSLGGAVQLLFS